MAFPCSGCDGCGSHTDQPFQADNSSTLIHVTCSQQQPFFQCKECTEKSDTCAISQSYMEGSSWKASVVEDVVYLGGEASFDDEAMRNQYGTHFQFGCQSSETGLFVTQVADGIMGLSNSDHHIVAKLHHENKIPSNLFSLCFTENGGTMAIGEPNSKAHRGDISYAKVISDRSASHFYNVNVKDIRIGGKSINAKEEAYTRGHYIVDSGTTDSYLPRALKTEFLQVFKEVAGRDYQVGTSCHGYTNEDLASLPSIQLVMEAYGDENAEVILDIPPEQYLLHNDNSYCGSIYLSENSGGVIGANLMMNRDVIFDNGNQRVGFVDADCAYQGGNASTTTMPSIGDHIVMNNSESGAVPSATTAAVPVSTSAVAATATPTAAPTAEQTPAPTAVQTAAPIAESTTAPKSVAIPAATPETTLKATKVKATSEPTATTIATPQATMEVIPESTSASVTSEPSSTAAATPVTAVDNATMVATTSSDSVANFKALSEEATTTTQSSSSADFADLKTKEKSGTHPLVLTIVGAVLVVGFLLMMLISVSRRRQKTSKDQLWSRVKGSEEDEDDDDEEEFGLVRNDKKGGSTKHQRLDQEEDDDHHGQDSSSDEEDEISVFCQHGMRWNLDWATATTLLVLKSSTVDNVANAKTIDSPNHDVKDYQESIRKEPKLLRGSAVPWPSVQKATVSGEQTNKPSPASYAVISGITENKFRGESPRENSVVPTLQPNNDNVQDANVNSKSASTNTSHDSMLGPGFVWNGTDSKVGPGFVWNGTDSKVGPGLVWNGNDSKVGPGFVWNGNDSMVGSGFVWNGNDSKVGPGFVWNGNGSMVGTGLVWNGEMEIPSMDTSQADENVEGTDTSKTGLSEIEWIDKPVEGDGDVEIVSSVTVYDEFVQPKLDNCNPCELPTYQSARAPIHPQDHLPHVIEDYESWEVITDTLRMVTNAPTQNDDPTGIPVSASNEHYTDRLPQVDEIFETWEDIKKKFTMYPDTFNTVLPTVAPYQAPPHSSVSTPRNDYADQHPRPGNQRFKDWESPITEKPAQNQRESLGNVGRYDNSQH
ncbi:unnamed protein product [Phytophthora fragariaefolia]|uniref:Unnamed protein product n=1 Tax=Phytophthora fragariaefolia TaxID=1490495 RepID=A0A9W6U957_9STRA|nr:unnamed protein product [Phytophthora fragariaefolia]